MSKSKCCVQGCKSYPPHFKFPTSRVLVRKWLAALETHSTPQAAQGAVCSRHFRSEQWECARGRVRLKRGEVPSIFDQVEKQDASANPSDNVPIADSQDNYENSNDSQASLETDQQKDSDDPQKDSDTEPHNNDSQKDNNCLEKERNDPQKESSDPQKESSDRQKESSDSINETDDTKMDENSTEKPKNTSSEKNDGPQKERNDQSEESDQQKDRPKEKEMYNGRKESGEERVQDSTSKEEVASKSDKLDRKKNKEKKKESIPKLPSGPRDIDKDKVEDIEDLLTYYHIKQNNIHNASEAAVEANGGEVEQLEIEFEPAEPPSVDPVFIEISVDKDTTTPGEKNDCLMVLESVQVDVDPSTLMLQEPDYQDEEIETLEIEEDPPVEKGDPISLLSSSDEDDVIIQEPHIDTVEVSDETDEDDMPLVKLLRKRRAEKKKISPKKVQRKNNFSQISWGLYDYFCVQCHYKTTSRADYKKHMAGHAKVIMMCQACGYMTASASQFAKHERQHGEKSYKCDLCDFKAKRNISLIYHMKTHKQASKKEFKCGECDFVAFSDKAILGHLRFCNDGKRFKCDKCSYATKKRSDLKRHKARKHDEEDKDEDYVPPARVKD